MADASYDKSANSNSLASEVMRLLDDNSFFTAKAICAKLGLSYAEKGNYVNQIKHRWKEMIRKSRRDFVDLGCHANFGKAKLGVGYEPNDVWKRSGFRGGMWTFVKRDWGSLKWFPSTGTILWSIRRPYSIGRVLQLLAYGFSFTGVVTDLKEIERLMESARFVGAHRVFDVRRRLPYVKIDVFRESNGVEIVLGDRSHPTSVEVKFRYPLWAERNEQLLEGIYSLLKGDGDVRGRPDSGVGRV